MESEIIPIEKSHVLEPLTESNVWREKKSYFVS